MLTEAGGAAGRLCTGVYLPGAGPFVAAVFRSGRLEVVLFAATDAEEVLGIVLVE